MKMTGTEVLTWAARDVALRKGDGSVARNREVGARPVGDGCFAVVGSSAEVFFLILFGDHIENISKLVNTRSVRFIADCLISAIFLSTASEVRSQITRSSISASPATSLSLS
jgi:hypothetical protein